MFANYILQWEGWGHKLWEKGGTHVMERVRLSRQVPGIKVRGDLHVPQPRSRLCLESVRLWLTWGSTGIACSPGILKRSQTSPVTQQVPTQYLICGLPRWLRCLPIGNGACQCRRCRLTHWKRSWCWERLKAGGEGDDREWGGWMASPTRWTWVWVNSGSWWRTGRPGDSWGHKESDTTERLNWTEWR